MTFGKLQHLFQFSTQFRADHKESAVKHTQPQIVSHKLHVGADKSGIDVTVTGYHNYQRCPLEKEVIRNRNPLQKIHKRRTNLLSLTEQIDADFLCLILLAAQDGEGNILGVATRGTVVPRFQDLFQIFFFHTLGREMADGSSTFQRR